jgi:hypothetical protein
MRPITELYTLNKQKLAFMYVCVCVCARALCVRSTFLNILNF